MSRFGKHFFTFHRGRFFLIRMGCLLAGALLVGRLFQIQIIDGAEWSARAAAQHETEQILPARRGMIAIQDKTSPEGVYPLAVTQDTHFLYASPKDIEDPERAARLIAPLLNKEEADLVRIFSKADDPWEPIEHGVLRENAESVLSLGLAGIATVPEPRRAYPEQYAASHVIGFVGAGDDGIRGRYGIEGYFDALLSGVPVTVKAERDARGTVLDGDDAALDGADIILTLDRRIQFAACEKLKRMVEKVGAEGGTVIVLEPKTGAIRAMCSVPDFDPNKYSDVDDPFVYTNPSIFSAYEPGSVFKPIAMAAGIETGAVEPESIYDDTGAVKINEYTIRNSDRKANGRQTMIEVLEKSLNTGMVHVARETDADLLATIVEAFGFGEKTGIELQTEVAGDVSSFTKSGFIFRATGSFGQGITTTPLQLAQAYGAIANGGMLIRPTIISEIRSAGDVVTKTAPVQIRRVVSPRTAALISGMLYSVVQNGHAKHAQVTNYTVAGKTGTAQIARSDGPGYEEGATIGSFVGFAPVHDPAFVIVTKIDRPEGNYFSSETAAPLFGELADFLLQYYNIPPDNPETENAFPSP